MCMFVCQKYMDIQIDKHVECFYSKKSSVNCVYVQLNHLFLQINHTNCSFCCAKVVQRFRKLCNENKKLICVSVNLVSV
jgi:hypothetical protein